MYDTHERLTYSRYRLGLKLCGHKAPLRKLNLFFGISDRLECEVKEPRNWTFDFVFGGVSTSNISYHLTGASAGRDYILLFGASPHATKKKIPKEKKA